MTDSKRQMSILEDSIFNKYTRIEGHLIYLGYDASMLSEVHMTVNHDSNVELYWLDMTASTCLIIATCEHIYFGKGKCELKMTMTNQIHEREVVNRLSCSRN